MICPECNIEMEPGEVYLKKVFSSRGWSDCYFGSLENSDIKNIRILNGGEIKESFYCTKCGIAVISPHTYKFQKWFHSI